MLFRGPFELPVTSKTGANTSRNKGTNFPACAQLRTILVAPKSFPFAPPHLLQQLEAHIRVRDLCIQTSQAIRSCMQACRMACMHVDMTWAWLAVRELRTRVHINSWCWYRRRIIIASEILPSIPLPAKFVFLRHPPSLPVAQISEKHSSMYYCRLIWPVHIGTADELMLQT